MKYAVMCALALITVLVAVMPSAAVDFEKKGFRVTYEPWKEVETVDIPNSTYTDGANHQQNRKKATLHLSLTGAVRNEYARNITTMSLVFAIAYPDEGRNEQATVTVSSLGPQERRDFRQALRDIPDGSTSFQVRADLVKLQVVYKDGTTEEIKP
ncbi:MAG: hypothetical protein RDV48_17315 [Candidatus Eremiobacteraeota bacterium]|nr:hypothetical protein [Candidatus Eremiobacteraeota bacterium]